MPENQNQSENPKTPAPPELPSSLLSTLVGFLVTAGIIYGIYSWYLKPKGWSILPKNPVQVSLPSSAPILKINQDKDAEGAVSSDDNLATIQRELDETVIEDFSDDLGQIKGVIDRL